MHSIGKKIVVGTSYIALSNSLGRVASFISVIIVTRALSLYEYGLITLALAITGPAFAIMGLGLDQLIEADVARYLGEKKIGKAKQLLYEFYSMRFVLMVLIVAAGWTFRSLLQNRYGTIIVDATLIILLYIAIQYVKTSYNTIIQTHQSFKAFAVINGLEPYVRLAFILGVVFFAALSVPIVLISYVIAPAVMVVVATPHVWNIMKQYRRVPVPDTSTLVATMKAHGKWQSVLFVIGSITDNIKYFVIQLILSTEAVAVYAVAQSAYSAYANLVPLKTVITPIISQFSSLHDKLQKLMAKAAKYTILTYCIIGLTGIVLSPFIIFIFFPKYTGSILVLQILLLRFPFNFSAMVHVPALKALREQKFLSAIAPVNIFSLFLIGVPLTRLFGVYGMAIETLVVIAIQVIAREWRLRIAHNIRTINLRAMFTYDETDRFIVKTISAAYARKKARWSKHAP